ncbi:helix-turn-helix domain containing protein [Escherichia albertii]|nr:helix-turn-helix domain containing protein [Escherichia albertii]
MTVGYPQTNRKIDTGKTLTRWPVFVDHFKEQLSTREVTARFNISDRSVVQRWLRIYNTLGAEGLLKRKQGRSKSLNKDTKPQKAQEELEKSPEELSPEELRDELRYLRAENAYLKKLEALVQSKKLKKKRK